MLKMKMLKLDLKSQIIAKERKAKMIKIIIIFVKYKYLEQSNKFILLFSIEKAKLAIISFTIAQSVASTKKFCCGHNL